MTDPEYLLRQDGGLPDLGLANIDQRLDWPDKSVERISDPKVRLLVLWTLIGQYGHAASTVDPDQDGAFTVQSAQMYQLLSAWSHETRRVIPQHRLESDRLTSKKVDSHLGEGKPLEAYLEVLEVRDWMPEFMHPDVRFDLFHTIWEKAEPISNQDSFREIVFGEMVIETIPGGLGFCDNAERLRRYELLGRADGIFTKMVSDFVAACIADAPPENPDFFDTETNNISTICDLIAERKYDRLGAQILAMNVLDMEDELTIISMMD